MEPLNESTVITTIDSMKPSNDGKLHVMFVPVYMAIIIILSILASYIVNTSCFVFFGLYFVYLFVLHIWHYQAHHDIWWVPFNKACRKYHHDHHWVNFPPNKFYGSPDATEYLEKYKNNKMYTILSALPAQSSIEHESLIYLIFLGIITVEFYIFKFNTATILMTGLEAIVFGLVGNYLHMAYHVKDHYLSKYHWFQNLRWIHYCHHLNTAKT